MPPDETPFSVPERPVEAAHELTSWKEIADYFNVSIKTVQNWERRWGLPVLRRPGAKGRVLAYTGELAAWKASRVSTLQEGSHGMEDGAVESLRRRISTPKFLRLYSLVLTLILLALLGAWLAHSLRWGMGGRTPALSRLEDKTLVITDTHGNEVWRKTFAEPFHLGMYNAAVHPVHLVWIGELNAHPGQETLFVYDPVSRAKDGATLFCFSATGEEIWRFRPGRSVTDGQATYSGTYVMPAFAVANLDGQGDPEIVATSHHFTEHPNQVVVLGADGALRQQYWHSGHLEHLVVEDLDGDRRPEILLGGVNNGYRFATLVVLDADGVGGASAQEPGDPHQIQDMPPAAERSRLLFPRSCMNKRRETSNRIHALTVLGDSIKVDVLELTADSGALILYYLNKRLAVGAVRFSDILAGYHHRFSLSGELDHRLSSAEVDELRFIRTLPGP